MAHIECQFLLSSSTHQQFFNSAQENHTYNNNNDRATRATSFFIINSIFESALCQLQYMYCVYVREQQLRIERKKEKKKKKKKKISSDLKWKSCQSIHLVLESIYCDLLSFSSLLSWHIHSPKKTKLENNNHYFCVAYFNWFRFSEIVGILFSIIYFHKKCARKIHFTFYFAFFTILFVNIFFVWDKEEIEIQFLFYFRCCKEINKSTK